MSVFRRQDTKAGGRRGSVRAVPDFAARIVYSGPKLPDDPRNPCKTKLHCLPPLINPPQRKRASFFKIRIDVIDEIKTPIVIRADGRFLLTKGEGIEGPSIFPKQDLNDDQISVALLIDRKNFGENWCHWQHFLCPTITKMTSVFAHRPPLILHTLDASRSRNEPYFEVQHGVEIPTLEPIY